MLTHKHCPECETDTYIFSMDTEGDYTVKYVEEGCPICSWPDVTSEQTQQDIDLLALLDDLEDT